ncbi:MAG: FkbM family methyltransferase [Chloroflexi bacterium]|nr:FkbM family methyltransferase [Chloroflexota bacterium]
MEVSFSHSRIWVEEPSGVAALVNCMGVYDYNNMNLVRLILERGGGTFFDVGANIGSYSLYASENPQARVLAFEPHPKAYQALVRNLRLNNRVMVQAFPIGLSDASGKRRMASQGDLATSRILKPDEVATDTLLVDCTTLDAVCEELGAWPTVIKIDVEGHEQEVLKGASSASASALVILVEDSGRSGTRDLLIQKGFGGPWYFHFASGEFRESPQRRPEDPVYIRDSARSVLMDWGLRIVRDA